MGADLWTLLEFSPFKPAEDLALCSKRNSAKQNSPLMSA